MKMQNQKLLAITLLLSFSLTFFSSCSKDDDDPSFPNAEKDIVSTPWIITDATPNGNEIAIIALAFIAAFDVDTEYSFFTDGTFAYDADAQSGTDDWEITSNGTVLTLNKDTDDEEVYTITAISESGMTWVMNYNEEGVSGTITYVLKPAV